MVQVLRYSKEGFKSQKQKYHYDDMKKFIEEFNIEDYPKHLGYAIKQIKEKKEKFFDTYKNDLEEGIWCFILGHKNNQSLNHLKEKVPAWVAELPNDTICYDVNWENQIRLSDDIVKWAGCYIPKRELEKLQNIKRYKNNKREE